MCISNYQNINYLLTNCELEYTCYIKDIGNALHKVAKHVTFFKIEERSSAANYN